MAIAAMRISDKGKFNPFFRNVLEIALASCQRDPG